MGQCTSTAGGMRCEHDQGHDGPHQCFRCDNTLEGQWFDCPGGHRLCGGTMSTAERALMGECGLCWGSKQSKCEHGCILGGYCSACDARDAAAYREAVRSGALGKE